MNVFCGSTPFLDLSNYYKLFDRIGLKYVDQKQVEQWCQGVLGSYRGPIKEEVSVNKNYRLKAEQLFNFNEKEIIVIVENNQNAFFLDFWQEQDKDGFFLLLYNTPEIALALAIENGVSSSQFIEQWKSSVRQMLSFQRRNRGRSILVDANAAITYPELFFKLFSDRSNLPICSNEIETSFVNPTTLVISMWLSEKIVAKDDELIALVSELEACGTPIGVGEGRMVDTVSSIEEEYRQIIRNVKQIDLTNNELLEVKKNVVHQTNLNKKLEQENQLCNSQLNQVQEELQLLFQNSKKDNDDCAVEKDETVLENELLFIQLHQLQEELEFYYNENLKLSTLCKDIKNIEIDGKGLSEDEKNSLYKTVNKKTVKKLFDVRTYRKLTGKYCFPFHHYLKKGWKKQISPHPLFDPVFYIEANQLFWLKECPLVHFVAFGNALELSPHPLFDTKWYLSRYPDVKESGVNPLIHYLDFGAFEGRNPSKNFNTNKYLNTYLDVKESKFNPLVHFVLYGEDECRITV